MNNLKFLFVIGIFTFILLASSPVLGSIYTNSLNADGDSVISANLNVTGRIKNTATCVVDLDGYGDYSYIEGCIDMASSGGLIIVSNGSYTTQNKALPNYLTIKCKTKGGCDLTTGSTQWTTTNKKGVVIDGFNIYSSGSAFVNFDGCLGCTIENNEFNQSSTGTVQVSITETSGGKSGDITIKNNKFNTVAGSVVLEASQGTNIIEGNHFNCSVSGEGDDFISFGGTNNFVIRDNVFDGVSGNLCNAIRDDTGVNGGQIYGNHFRNLNSAGAFGVTFTLCNDVIVSLNDFYNCQLGIQFDSCTRYKAMGNTFNDTGNGATTYGAIVVNDDNGSPIDGTINYNTFDNCGHSTGGSIYIDTTSNTADGLDIKDNMFRSSRNYDVLFNGANPVTDFVIKDNTITESAVTGFIGNEPTTGVTINNNDGDTGHTYFDSSGGLNLQSMGNLTTTNSRIDWTGTLTDDYLWELNVNGVMADTKGALKITSSVAQTSSWGMVIINQGSGSATQDLLQLHNDASGSRNLRLSGANREMEWDTNDYMKYDTASDEYEFYIGDTEEFKVGPNSVTSTNNITSGEDVIVSTNNMFCLDGEACSHSIYYNGTHTIMT